ncbi:hypothetical protein D9599_03655 [Roseomonas sp. KE2513]|uniref:hypothetical protein n=1 Tax=Roseomonas sp. KE2513 TaxID=2479202 RepID=UPI0018E0518B|nr:hypothetical protein [Roseomonas sp. KE2513]MBI0534664.1 hypothetical protein [Roseomonas sp. KE2513]
MSEGNAALPEFRGRLLVSIPGSWIDRLRLPGSLFGREVLRDIAMPVELRAALALLSAEADAQSVPLQFVARPEIFTHGRSRAWLDDRIGNARDHVILTDGHTLRTLPGLRNHMFFYPRGIPAQEAALRRLIGIAPELFSGLASQINGGLAFRCGGAWHRPPGVHLRLRTTPDTGRVERFPFLAARLHDDADPRPVKAAPAGEALPEDRPVRYVPLSETALADGVFMRDLAERVQRAIFGGPERLLLELSRPEGSPSATDRMAAATLAFSETRVAFPRSPSRNVQFVTAPPRGLRMDSLLIHPGIAFWRYGLDFYGAAERIEVPVGTNPVNRFRNLLSSWLGRPVAVLRQDAVGEVPRVTLSEAP